MAMACASDGDKQDAVGTGSVTLQINNGAAIWVRVDGSICPSFSVSTKAGTNVPINPLPITCCTCGVAAKVAVYRKFDAGKQIPFKWDGREY